MNVTFHIILQKPPANLAFGLQKGSGSNYETVQIQRSVSEDLFFSLSAEVKGNKQKDMLPDFKGAFVQGPLMGRFIYIDIGALAGQADTPAWRLKIPLSGITWEMIEKLYADPNAILKTRVPGTGKNGGPNCATVKPFDGWHIKAS